MNNPQPPTPVYVKNSTVYGISNRDIKQKRSKYIDVQFYCVRDRVGQDKIVIYWKPGAHNLCDYITKHASATHDVAICPTYLHVPAH